MPKKTAPKKPPKTGTLARRVKDRPDGATVAVEGNLERDIAFKRRQVETGPEDALALSNLVVALARAGRLAEARRVGLQLKALTPERDAWGKVAEALSFLGDDEGVLETYEGARAAGVLDAAANGPVLDHLVAAAMARLGRVGEARYHWGQVLKVNPSYAVATRNLDDLSAPIESRNGPWAFEIHQWIELSVLQDVANLVTRFESRDEAALTRELRRYVAGRPELPRLVPILLERGDPFGRGFALHLATTLATPETLAALRDFALSRNGTDADRLRALGVVQDWGLLEGDAIRVFQEGEWREIEPINFEIVPDVPRRHGPQVETLAGQATRALREGRPEDALRLLQQALALEPDAPDLGNNLAATYTQLGRADEAAALVRQIHQAHPDYFFGQIGVAQLETRARRFAASHQILDALASRRRYSKSEFVALSLAEIEVFLAEKNPDAARSWLDLVASVDPEHPSIPGLRKIIERAR